jgi:small GTP-binding protein
MQPEIKKLLDNIKKLNQMHAELAEQTKQTNKDPDKRFAQKYLQLAFYLFRFVCHLLERGLIKEDAREVLSQLLSPNLQESLFLRLLLAESNLIERESMRGLFEKLCVREKLNSLASALADYRREKDLSKPGEDINRYMISEGEHIICLTSLSLSRQHLLRDVQIQSINLKQKSDEIDEELPLIEEEVAIKNFCQIQFDAALTKIFQINNQGEFSLDELITMAEHTLEFAKTSRIQSTVLIILMINKLLTKKLFRGGLQGEVELKISGASKTELSLLPSMNAVAERLLQLKPSGTLNNWQTLHQVITNSREVVIFDELRKVLSQYQPYSIGRANAARVLQKRIVSEVKIWMRQLFEYAGTRLGEHCKPRHCDYSLIATGSFARQDSTPYSDLEALLLLKEKQDTSYFQTLLRLVSYQLITLGEGEYDKTSDYPGFRFDEDQNPSKSEMFIGTVQQLAKEYGIEQAYKQSRVMQDADDFPFSLVKTAEVVSTELANIPQHEKLARKFQENYFSDAVPQDQSVEQEQLVQQDKTKQAGLGYLKKHISVFLSKANGNSKPILNATCNIKKDLLAPFTYLCMDLAAFYGIRAASNHDILEELGNQGIFDNTFVKICQSILAELYFQRLEQHLTHKKAHDDCLWTSKLLAIHELILVSIYQRLDQYLTKEIEQQFAQNEQVGIDDDGLSQVNVDGDIRKYEFIQLKQFNPVVEALTQRGDLDSLAKLVAHYLVLCIVVDGELIMNQPAFVSKFIEHYQKLMRVLIERLDNDNDKPHAVLDKLQQWQKLFLQQFKTAFTTLGSINNVERLVRLLNTTVLKPTHLAIEYWLMGKQNHSDRERHWFQDPALDNYIAIVKGNVSAQTEDFFLEVLISLIETLTVRNSAVEKYEEFYRLLNVQPAYRRQFIVVLTKVFNDHGRGNQIDLLIERLHSIPTRRGLRESTRLAQKKLRSDIEALDLKTIANTTSASTTSSAFSTLLSPAITVEIILPGTPNQAIRLIRLDPEVVRQLFIIDVNHPDLGHIKRTPGMNSKHSVRAINYRGVQLHFKENPDHPCMDLAIYLLKQRVIGHGAVVNVIARCNVHIPGKAEPESYPMLISQTMGETINVNQLDDLYPKDIFELILFDLLARPGDGKPLNWRFVLNAGKKSLVCIDNDQHFVEPFKKQLLGYKLIENSMLFCLPQMQQPLRRKYLMEFTQLDPLLLLLDWLNEMVLYEESYLNLWKEEAERRKIYNQDKINPRTLHFLLAPGMATDLLMTLLKLQNWAQEKQHITPLDILEKLNSRVVIYYKSAFAKYPKDTAKRFETVKADIFPSVSTKEVWGNSLGKVPTEAEIEAKQDYSSKEAINELKIFVLEPIGDSLKVKVNSDDSFDVEIDLRARENPSLSERERQKAILTKKISGHSYRRLIINGCVILDATLLKTVIEHSKQTLNYLDLRQCPLIDEVGIQYLANDFPNLEQLYLSECKGLKRLASTFLGIVRPLVFKTLKVLHAARCVELNHVELEAPELIELKLNESGSKNNECIVIKLQTPKLQELNLREVKFKTIVNQLPALKEIDISYCVFWAGTRDAIGNAIAEETLTKFKYEGIKEKVSALLHGEEGDGHFIQALVFLKEGRLVKGLNAINRAISLFPDERYIKARKAIDEEIKRSHSLRVPNIGDLIKLKAVLIGDYCGKTALSKRVAYHVFSDSTPRTIGIDFFLKRIDVGPHEIGLQIWDKASGDGFDTLMRLCCQDTHIIFVCFSIADRTSFDSIVKWFYYVKQLVPENVLTVMVGTQCDLEDDKREVSDKEANALKEELNFAFYMQCSAKSNVNVEELFHQTVELYIKQCLIFCRAEELEKEKINPFSEGLNLDEPSEPSSKRNLYSFFNPYPTGPTDVVSSPTTSASSSSASAIASTTTDLSGNAGVRK